MTEEEMYALEFSPEELCEEPSAEEPEMEYHCPVCHATELQYAMHYRVSDDDETQELRCTPEPAAQHQPRETRLISQCCSLSYTSG